MWVGWSWAARRQVVRMDGIRGDGGNGSVRGMRRTAIRALVSIVCRQ
jgi:hypothetical protein